ncbi:hypothetical protein ABPG73_022719, partial [Tetrahymena malaccensis]
QQDVKSTHNLSTIKQLTQKYKRSNQKQEFKSSHTLIKNDEQKIIDSGYKEIFENLFNLLNQEMEKIYNEQNTQSDQKDLAKNIKSHQVSQMIKKEPENQILNQVNISNTKKEKEYQIIVYISFHSDLTFKKKIKSNINRNLAKNKFYDGHSYVSQQYTQISKFVQKQLDFSDLLQAKSYTKMQAPQIQIIINQIKELNIDEKLLELQRFENIKENRLLSKAYQDQKAKVIQKLKEKNIQLIKIVVLHDKKSLVFGYQNQSAQELTDQDDTEIVSFIYHNPIELELDCLDQIFSTTQIECDHIKIDQDNISIFIIKKCDFEVLIQEKFQLLTKFENIKQINGTSIFNNEKKYRKQYFFNTDSNIQNIFAVNDQKSKKASDESPVINFINKRSKFQEQNNTIKYIQQFCQKTTKEMDKQNILSVGQQDVKSTHNLSTINQLTQKDQDSNQKQDFNSSPTIIKNDEMKIANTQNKESSQNVNYLPKQDIEEIQNEQNSQCDQEDLEKNSKSHQVSQMIKKEPENQILNQINLKKEEEDQKIIPISLHSDLTLKKKIQSLFNRNLAKSKLLQNAVIQASNFKEAQYAIITYENKENTICHQYLSTIQNSNVTSKQQKSTFQNSQTQTIRKGTQNIPYLIKHEGEPSKDEQISQKIYDQQHLNDFLIASVQDQAQQENQEMIFDNLFQQNTYKLNQNNQQQFKYGYQSDFSKEQTQVRSNQFDQIQLDISDLKQAQDKTNQLQIEKKLSKSYASQIEKIINQIKELKIDEKELEQQKFENTNENQLLSKTFQDQKAKIFQQLKEKNVQLTKIIVSHDKQTLVLGYQNQSAQELTNQNNTEIILFIYHNPNELELNCLDQIFSTSQIQFDHIKIDQDNISIFIIKKCDFEVLIQEKFKLLTKLENISQINDQPVSQPFFNFRNTSGVSTKMKQKKDYISF